MTLVVVARGAALGPLRPLLREHERLREVRVVDPGPIEALCEAAAGAEGLLLVDDRRRAPRTALPGPFLLDPSGRAVPAGWLPDLGSGLDVFARAAARVQRRAGPPGPLAVLGQWEPRYLQLAGRLEANLCRGGAPPFPVYRWTSERITRCRPRRRTAARARGRHLLRTRPAEGLGRLPRAPGQPPRGGGRRAARSALLGHLPDREPLAGRPLLLGGRRHGRGSRGGGRSGGRRRSRRQHALDARPRRFTPLWRVPPRACAARGLDARGLTDARTASSATLSHSSQGPRKAPVVPSASLRRHRSSQRDRGRDRGRAPRNRRGGSGDRRGLHRPERHAGGRGSRLADGDGDRGRRRAALRAQLHGRGAEGDHDLRQPRGADAYAGWPSRRPHRAGGNHRPRRRLTRRRGRRDLLGVASLGSDRCGPGRIVRRNSLSIPDRLRGARPRARERQGPAAGARRAARRRGGAAGARSGGPRRNGRRPLDRHHDGRELLARGVGSGGRAGRHRPGGGARPLGPGPRRTGRRGRARPRRSGHRARRSVRRRQLRPRPRTRPRPARTGRRGSRRWNRRVLARRVHGIRAARSARDRGVPAVQRRPRRTGARRGSGNAPRRVGDGGGRPAEPSRSRSSRGSASRATRSTSSVPTRRGAGRHGR